MKNLIGSLSLLTLSVAVSFSAQAGTHYDSHGNVGYDTLTECQDAIRTGAAKFYKSSTNHKPMLRGNEVAVRAGRLGNLAPQYSRGTCDIGTGRRGGRDGVAKAIQGKYIPYSPNMGINQYVDASGKIVRVSMQQCDNWFSGAFPTGMPKPIIKPQPIAKPQPVIKPVVIEPVVIEPIPQPVVTAPVTPPPQPVVVTPTPASAVTAATGSIPTWVPVAAGVIGVAILASSGDDSDGTTGTTGTTGTN